MEQSFSVRLMHVRFFLKLYRSCVLSSLVLYILAAALPAFGAEAESLRRDAVVRAVEQASPAVVNISTEEEVRRQTGFMSPFASDPFFDRFFEDFFDHGYEKKYTERSLGSGIIFDKSGHILTNWHVVERATRIKVILMDEKSYEAKLIGSAPELDLAVLKIDAGRDLPTVVLGSSEDLMIGEKVIAIGNPFGLSHTVTTGVISAVRRSIKASDRTYRDFIQTDASINPGNSGGPLLNIDGQLIGVNSAIYGQGAQGIGFAIPINKAKRVVDELILYGKLAPVWIGIQVQELTADLAGSLQFKGAGGVLVRRVDPESPAEEAGIRPSDIITGIGRDTVKSTEDYLEILRQYPPREEITVALFRDGWQVSSVLKTEEFPLEKAQEIALRLLGIEVKELVPGLKEKGTPAGVAITKIRSGSRIDRAGVKAGDIMLQINNTALNGLQDFQRAIANIYQARSMVLLIQRGHYGYYLTIPLDS
ncbi:MAG TPA: Do family serine endopeptidase [Thermodesulfobacteriota bacterium]|nr:Do family serine endopeptidase [Thermodesulfobacteriota bacterium]